MAPVLPGDARRARNSATTWRSPSPRRPRPTCSSGRRRETPLFDNSIFPWAYYDTTVALVATAAIRSCGGTRRTGSGSCTSRRAPRPTRLHGDRHRRLERPRAPGPTADTCRCTLPDVSFSDVAESPGDPDAGRQPPLFMWTTNSDQSLTYGTSSDPVTRWGNSRRLREMLDHTTIGWWRRRRWSMGPAPTSGPCRTPGSDSGTCIGRARTLRTLAARPAADPVDALPGARGAAGRQCAGGRGDGERHGPLRALEFVRLRGELAGHARRRGVGPAGQPRARRRLERGAAGGVPVPRRPAARVLLVVRAKAAGEGAPPDTLQVGVRVETFEDLPPRRTSRRSRSSAPRGSRIGDRCSRGRARAQGLVGWTRSTCAGGSCGRGTRRRANARSSGRLRARQGWARVRRRHLLRARPHGDAPVQKLKLVVF